MVVGVGYMTIPVEMPFWIWRNQEAYKRRPYLRDFLISVDGVCSKVYPAFYDFACPRNCFSFVCNVSMGCNFLLRGFLGSWYRHWYCHILDTL